jgi:hypothetical protein
MTVWPTPMRLVQRAMLWARTLRASQAAFAPEATGWQMIQSDTVFQVPDGVFDHCVAAVVSFEFDGVAVAVGQEAVIRVVDQQGLTAIPGWA